MRTIYLDLGMGAAGDMLTAALLELLPEEEQEKFLAEMNSMGIPNVEIVRERVPMNAIIGSRMRVMIQGEEEGEHIDFRHNHNHETHTHNEPPKASDREFLNEKDNASDPGEYVHQHIIGSGSGEYVHQHIIGSGSGEYVHQHDNGGDPGEYVHRHDNGSDFGGHAHHHHHHGSGHGHASMQDVEEIIDNLTMGHEAKEDILAVYKIIAQAESRAHGTPVSEIHFHEVGMMDAIADIAAVCLLMRRLAPARIIASPVHVGSGHVRCAHGILPVPAPATAYILEGVPIYGGKIKGELCTPTGAALVRYFADAFDDMPVMTVQAVGYGFGKKEFEQMNCLRAFLGETNEVFANATAPDLSGRQVAELVCNIDDMTGEEIGFACEQLLESGAREVFTVAAQMKKFRPGIILHVITDAWREEEMVRRIFALTTTIGVRSSATRRYVLERQEETVQTPLGEVRRKTSSGYGVERNKWEYDDLAVIGREHGMNVREVREVLDAAEAEG